MTHILNLAIRHASGWDMHSVLVNFLAYMDEKSPGWQDYDSLQTVDDNHERIIICLNSELKPFNGWVREFISDAMRFEFETQEDLTQFVVTYS